MERVAFLIEKTGDRIPCLLNPDSVVVRRLAGVRPRHSSSGPLTGAALKDDPLLYTGGGMTELLLDLLFDVSLLTAPDNAPSTTENVQDLTQPLANLAEGSVGEDGYGQLPLVRLIWGKAWNVLGVVAAVAERLENFTPAGVPQRSWLRMRLLRVGEVASADREAWHDTRPLEDLPDENSVSPGLLNFHQVQGAGEDSEGNGSSERLDEIAAAHYGDSTRWRLIAAFNKIDNPWDVPPGNVLMIPPGSSSGGTA